MAENKEVGPAIVRHVTVKVDDQPAPTWHDALVKLLGPGRYSFTESRIIGHVFSAGESMEGLAPHGPDGGSLTSEKGGPLYTALDKERHRLEIDICYCSTLDECWT